MRIAILVRLAVGAGLVANVAPEVPQTHGGRVLPWPASAADAAVGDLLELWPTRLLVGRGGDWFDGGSASESKLINSVRDLSQFYLKSLGNDVGRFFVKAEVLQSGGRGGCLDEGRFAASFDFEGSMFIGLGMSGVGEFEVGIEDPRGSASRSPPFNKKFVYVAKTGEVVLFPAWAVVSVKRHVPTGDEGEHADNGCECISYTAVSVSVAPRDDMTKLSSTSDQLDHRIIITKLASKTPHDSTVGDPSKGLGSFNGQTQHGLTAFPGGATEVFDIFGSWALRLSLEEVLSMLPPKERSEITKISFHEELERLAYNGLRLPHLKKFAGHKRNGELFKYQHREWQAGRPWPELWSARAFRQLQALFEKAASYWLALIERKYSVEYTSSDLDKNMFIWAAVLGEGLGHEEHHHRNSAVSGVYYVNAPRGSGQLLLKDPRGPYPPFQAGVFPYKPSGGDFILFPSWLRHQVEGSAFPKDSKEPGQATKARRICYAMNLEGSWETSAHVHRHHTLEL